MADQGIPQTAKEFEEFYYRERAQWPLNLHRLGQVAEWVLKLMDQPNFEKSPAMIAMSKAALLAFAEAYAKHKGGA